MEEVKHRKMLVFHLKEQLQQNEEGEREAQEQEGFSMFLFVCHFFSFLFLL